MNFAAADSLRHGLIVEADATTATSRAERGSALDMIERHDPGSTRRLMLGCLSVVSPMALPSAFGTLAATRDVALMRRNSRASSPTTIRHPQATAFYWAAQRRRARCLGRRGDRQYVSRRWIARSTANANTRGRAGRAVSSRNLAVSGSLPPTSWQRRINAINGQFMPARCENISDMG